MQYWLVFYILYGILYIIGLLRDEMLAELLLDEENIWVREIQSLYFTPPKEIEKFLIMRSLLAGLGATIRCVYSTKHREYYRTKLAVSVPKSMVGIAEKIIRRFGGKIRDREILVTGNYRGFIATHRDCVGFPIGVSDHGLLVGVELPSRVVVAGDEKPCLSLMKFLAMQYLREVGSCCFILGRRVEGVGAVSDEIPVFEGALGSLAEALARMYNMLQNASGIARILLRFLRGSGLVVSEEGATEGGEVEEGAEFAVGREVEVVEWLLGSVRFGRFREGVVSYDLSGLSDGHRVVVSYYLMHALFPFVFGVSDVFLDYARHSSSPRFVYYSPITNVDRLYAKSQADYIIVLTRGDATLYLPYRVGDKAGFAELRFQPLWRVVRG